MFVGAEISSCDEYKELIKYAKLNAKALRLVAAYLENEPRLVSASLIESLCNECSVSSAQAFAGVLSAAFGLDSEISDEDEILEREYIFRSVKKLDPETYTCDPYYKNIRIPEVNKGRWELRYESFAPYEGLIFDDLIIDGYREIPRIGFFEEEFAFPAVLENGREWMMITPNEINTMKEPIAKAHGKVLTFGLGMGYYAYMASLKEEVESVCVVERDPEVIALFEEFILPQFEHGEKIKIVCSDAFDYARRVMPHESFDIAFVDIWHDALDGLDLYIRMKKLEKESPSTEFVYWVERTLLSTLRAMVISSLEESNQTNASGVGIYDICELLRMLSDDYLRSLAADMQRK